MTTETGLTKIDLAALRAADSLQITAPETYGACIAHKKIAKTEKDPFAQDASHVVTARSTIDGYGIDISEARGFEVLRIYRADDHFAGNTIAAVLTMLKVGDELTFVFGADAHTTGALRDVGFHADTLFLTIRRNGKCFAKFELETRITDTQWRMVTGVKAREVAA